jgi:hypothetical protein
MTAVDRPDLPAATFAWRRTQVTIVGLGLLAAVLVRMSLFPGFVLLGDLPPILDWRPTQVAWGFLAVAISLNVIAGAPTGEFGPAIPLTGPVGIGGSTRMILGSIVVVVLLFAVGHRRAKRTWSIDPPATLRADRPVHILGRL